MVEVLIWLGQGGEEEKGTCFQGLNVMRIKKKTFHVDSTKFGAELMKIGWERSESRGNE